MTDSVKDSDRQLMELQAMQVAINRIQAIIEFDLEGNILFANSLFLEAMGYTLEEVQGKHHSIFCKPEYTQTVDYIDFWRRLAAGSTESGQFARVHKDGQTVWLQASYNPILDAGGNPYKIVKFATDISESTRKNAIFEAQAKAIDRSQAVIEVDLTGRVLQANQNFLDAFAYTLDEIVGQHHRLFCDPDYVRTPE